MMEIINNPAFLPSLFGFLAGFALVSLISSARGRRASSAAHTQEKMASEKIDRLQSEKSALETEIATMRSTEARLIKRQGELEALNKTDKQRESEIAGLLEKTKAALQSGLKAQETAFLEAIKKIPQPRAVEPRAAIPASSPPPLPPALPASPVAAEDLDFVPLENLPSSNEESTAFEGFAVDQTSMKAESAANAFRAALTDDKS